MKTILLSTALTLAALPAAAVTLLTGDVWQVTGLEAPGIGVEGSTLVFTAQTLLGTGNFAIDG